MDSVVCAASIYKGIFRCRCVGSNLLKCLCIHLILLTCIHTELPVYVFILLLYKCAVLAMCIICVPFILCLLCIATTTAFLLDIAINCKYQFGGTFLNYLRQFWLLLWYFLLPSYQYTTKHYRACMCLNKCVCMHVCVCTGKYIVHCNRLYCLWLCSKCTWQSVWARC